MKRLLVIFAVILSLSISGYSQEKEDVYSISILGGPRLFSCDSEWGYIGDYSRNSNGMILLSDTYKEHFKLGLSVGIYTKDFMREYYRSTEKYREFEFKYFAMQLFYTILYINNDRFRIGNGMSFTNSRLLKMTISTCYLDGYIEKRDVTDAIVRYNSVWSFKILFDLAFYFNKHIGIVALPYVEHIFYQGMKSGNERLEEQTLGFAYVGYKEHGGMWHYGVDLGIEYRF